MILQPYGAKGINNLLGPEVNEFKNDIISRPNRSYNMSRIKAKDTKPELIVRKNSF